MSAARSPGAIKDRPGRFELADGGTIFLDDIDDVPLAMQVKLLRVLQNRTVERLGGTRTVPVNVRIIAGSKRDLKQMVADGKFREDLFYRLNVLPLALPPLRERREDIPVLMEHFIERFFRAPRRAAPADLDGVSRRRSRSTLAGQRARARERVRAHRADLHVRHGAHRLRGREYPASRTSRTRRSRRPRPPASDDGERAISLDDRLREVEANLIDGRSRPATATSRRRQRCSRSSDRRSAIASGTAGSNGARPQIQTCPALRRSRNQSASRRWSALHDCSTDR